MYSHVPLTPGNTIRILILEPALQMAQLVVCKLKELSLDGLDQKKSPYEALSYVWGSPKGDRKLFCNGQPIFVTENCLAALRHLRHRGKTRTLWIDAICIDQSSVKERNHQVQLMGNVYKLARRVLIWLGVGNRLTGRLMRFLTWHSKALEYRTLHPSRKRLMELIKSHFMKQELQTVSHADHFEDAFPMEWCRRVWTLQELLMGRECIIVCGRHNMSWDRLSCWEDCILPTTTSVSCPDIDTAVLARYCFQIAMDLSAKKHLFLWDRTRNSQACLMVLSTMGRRSVSDPRDKVFGIFSILVELGVEIPEPDYYKTVCEVFQGFTLAMIRHLKNLAVLAYEDWKFNTVGWPSWVPNLECSGNHLIDIWDIPTDDFPYHEPKYLEGKLSVQGYDYGLIQILGTECPTLSMEKSLENFVAWLFQCYLMVDSFEKVLTKERTAVWSTLKDMGTSREILDILDGFWGRLLTESELAIHDTVLDFDKVAPAIHAGVSKFDVETCQRLKTLWTLVIRHKRIPFVSSSDHFGLGFDIAVNDVLVTLIGAEKHFVVRPDGNDYRMIGRVHISDRDRLAGGVKTSFTLV